MENKMKEEILEQILKYINETKDFILEQTPDLFQQIIKYEKISAIFGVCIYSFIFILLCGLSIYVWKSSIDENDIKGYLRFVFPFLSFIFFMSLIFSIETLIKINVAPKYFIIHKLVGDKK